MLEQLGLAESETDAFGAFVTDGTGPGTLDINAICRLLKTNHVVCCNVRDARGVALLAAGERPYSCFLPTGEDVRERILHGKSAGVVDGALAGFIESYAYVKKKRAKAEGTAPAQRCNAAVLQLQHHGFRRARIPVRGRNPRFGDLVRGGGPAAEPVGQDLAPD